MLTVFAARVHLHSRHPRSSWTQMAASINSSDIGLHCIYRISKKRLSSCSVNESCLVSCESSLIHTDGATFHLLLRSSRQTQASETY